MPNRSPYARFHTPAFALALLLLVGVGAASIWGIDRFSKRSRWVEHSYQVLTAIEALENAVRAAESAGRAYRITNSPAQHAEYLAAAPLAITRAQQLKQMVSDNPAQSARAERLRKRTVARIAELQRLIDIQEVRGAAVARAMTPGNRGLQLMHELDLAAADMRVAERRLLDARESSTDHAIRVLMGFVVAGTLLPVALLSVLMAGLNGENRRVRRLEREARDSMRALEDASAQRDKLSDQRRTLSTFTGLLQSCQTLEEATALAASVMRELLPHAGGRCYVLRASQNLAESVVEFGSPAVASAPLLPPGDCWALRRNQMHRCGRGSATPYCPHVLEADVPDAWTLCMPLAAHGGALGLLHLSGRDGEDHDAGIVEGVELIAEQLSQTMANLQLRETLRVQSLRDPLTGLYNRRYLEENLARELQRCERRGLPLAVMMLDVDHFKRFNDTHGHAAGDALLAQVGEVLVGMTRGEDMACRYGGEEFTLVLPEAPREVALRRAEQIRSAIAGLTVSHLRQTLGPVTVSIGLAMFPEDGATGPLLVNTADAALYRAKAQGRDRVVAAG